MAAIRAHDGTLAITSGKFIAFTFTRSPNLFHKLEIPGSDVQKSTVEDKDGGESVQADGDGARSASSVAVVNRALALAFSGSGRYLAVCDDLKMLHVYVTDSPNTWTLLSSRLLARRATGVTFTSDEAAVIVADKSGDVYKFPTIRQVKDTGEVEDKVEGELVLGHLSMVLDVCLAENYIATCDRDEKIRLSHFPNGYNIHTYCLGHTQFVSCLVYVEEFKLLISGSGDCTLRVWSMQGKQLCHVKCRSDQCPSAVTSRNSPSLQQQDRQTLTARGEKNSNENEEKSDKKDEESKDLNSRVAVQRLAYCRQCRLLVASFHCLPELQVYQFNMRNNEASLTLSQTIPLLQDPWDITFDQTNNTLWVLSPVKGSTLKGFNVAKVDNENWKLQEILEDSRNSEALKAVNGSWEFFSDSLSTRSPIPSLWKTATNDNVEDYQQRKQQRLQQQQRPPQTGEQQSVSRGGRYGRKKSSKKGSGGGGRECSQAETGSSQSSNSALDTEDVEAEPEKRKRVL